MPGVRLRQRGVSAFAEVFASEKVSALEHRSSHHITMKSDKSRQVKFNFFELNARISKIYLVNLSKFSHVRSGDRSTSFLSLALVLNFSICDGDRKFLIISVGFNYFLIIDRAEIFTIFPIGRQLDR